MSPAEPSPRPLVVFTGQGLARADGVNLVRRIRALDVVASRIATVPWKDRQNLDEIVYAVANAGDDALDALIAAMRSMCLHERRRSRRHTTHHAVLLALAERARERLVVHLTTNVDGLTSTLLVRELCAVWEPLDACVAWSRVIAAIGATLRQARGLIHLPVHGEAALVAALEAEPLLRTYYGDPRALPLPGPASPPWTSTLRLGLACGLPSIETNLPLARVGYGLLRSLLIGAPADLGPSQRAPALPEADLLAIGYGAGVGAGRSRYPFERTVDALLADGALRRPRQITALLHEAKEHEPSARWYAARGFAVSRYGTGGLVAAARAHLAAA